MGVYHVRLNSRMWAIAFAIYIILTLLIAIVMLIALLGFDMGWLFNLLCVIFLSCYVCSIYLFWKITTREVDATLFDDRAHLVLAKVWILKSAKEIDVRFSDIVKYTHINRSYYRHGYREAIILKMKDGTKYRIDTSLNAFRKIDDYSTLNFQGDFLAAFKKYFLEHKLTTKIIMDEDSRWTSALDDAGHLTDLADSLID